MCGSVTIIDRMGAQNREENLSIGKVDFSELEAFLTDKTHEQNINIGKVFCQNF